MSVILQKVESKPSTINSPEANAAFAELLKKTDYLSADERALLTKAFHFADHAHDGQLRSSGEPYITHPIAVAGVCASWKLDIHTLIAALLHDTIEDSDTNKDEVIKLFGNVTAEIVDGVTKLEKVEFNTREEGQAESFRKMLLAMARDIRVILVKLADRTHNMRTLGSLRADKRRRIGLETMEIYAPLANLLGLNVLYRELQDLSFENIWPWRAQTLKKAFENSKDVRADLFKETQTQIIATLQEAGIQAKITSWQKNLYSIYRKMENKQVTYAQVTDQFNFRVIVQSVEDCYQALGVLHHLYRPLINRFKDYIAIPKNNSYQSLHTTVIGPMNTSIDFQIRTELMNRIAEYGVTAYWQYKAEGDHDSISKIETKWVQALLDIQKETDNSNEFMDHIKVDLDPDSIYVFTPQSRIITLPEGATPIDFAYAIHSDIGDHCIAAKINAEQVPLKTHLQNGDVVEIITSPSATPNPSWLTFVRTGRARARIRAHLRTLEQSASVEIGERILAQALRSEGFPNLPPLTEEWTPIWEKIIRYTGAQSREELLSSIGFGQRVPQIAAKHLATLLTESGERPDLVLLSTGQFMDDNEQSQPITLLLNGEEESSVKYAPCCLPIPGDKIAGYLGNHEGLVIHIDDCTIMQQLQKKNPERMIRVAWSDEIHSSFEAGINLTVSTRIGMLAKISRALENIEADIVRIAMGDGSINTANTFHIVVYVKNRDHLAHALKTLRRQPKVLKAWRSKPIGNTAGAR